MAVSWSRSYARRVADSGFEARALVVDDDPDIRLLLRHVLGGAGLQVDEADGGAEALAVLGNGGPLPHVVVLDVQMPLVDGWDVLTALRRCPETADIPVVMCTVKSSTRDFVRAWELGCDAYVTTPFDSTSLIEQVRDVVLLDAGERVARRADALERAQARLADDRRQ